MNTLGQANNDDVYSETRALKQKKEMEDVLAPLNPLAPVQNDYNVVENQAQPQAPTPAPAEGEQPQELDPLAPLAPIAQEPVRLPAEEVTPETPNEIRDVTNELSPMGELARAQNNNKIGALDVFSYLTAPLSALGNAALAPIAGGAETPLEAFEMSGKAFMNSIFPTLGEDQENYGQQIVEREFGGLPEVMKGTMAIGLAILADPTSTLGVAAGKMAQKGLAAKKLQSDGVEPLTEKGIFETGVERLLGMTDDINPNKLTEIGHIARKADRGDKDAIATLNEALTDKKIVEQAKIAEAEAIKGQLDEFNAAFGDAAQPAIVMDEVALRQSLKKDGKLSADTFANAANINLSKYDIDEQASAMIQQTVEFHHDAITKARGNASMQWVNEQAENVSLTNLIGRSAPHYGAVEARALNNLLTTTAKTSQAKYAAWKANPSPVNALAFWKSYKLNAVVVRKVAGVKSEQGRALRVHREVGVESKPLQEQVNQMMKDMEVDSEMMALLGTMDLDKLAPHQVLKIADKGTRSFGRRMYDGMYETWVNAVLSGPLTHAVNITSTAAMTTLRPTQKYMEALSATARMDMLKASNDVKEANAMVTGMVSGISDVLRIATKKANKADINYPEELERAHELAKQKTNPALSGENFNQTGALGKMIDLAGSVIRMPGNALLKEDKAFKLINYRMSVNQEAMRKATSMGKTGEDTRALYQTYRNNPDEAVTKSAIDASQLYTFTNKLEGKLGKLEQVLKTPGVNLFVPFFRTPMNILKFGVRNSALGNIRHDLIPAIKGGPTADVARAKLATGSLVPAGLAIGFGDNLSGSVDMTTRKGRFSAEFEAPPYSVKIGDKWHSYARIEPIRSILGLVSTYQKAINSLDLTDKDEWGIAEEIAGATFMPFVDVVSENAYLEVFGHVHYLVEGITSGDAGFAMSKMQDMVAAMAVPNFMAQVTSLEMDTKFRMADTLAEKISKRIWGLSEDMPIRPNAFGEAQYVPRGGMMSLVNPFLTQPNKQDPIADEMMRLDVSIANTTPKEISVGGIPIELTTEQRSRMGVLIGRGISKKNDLGVPYVPPMRDMIRDAMSSTRWKKSPVEAQKRHIEMLYSSRRKVITAVMMKSDESIRKKYEDGILAKRESYKQAAQTGGVQ